MGSIFAVLASMCKQSSGLIFLVFCMAIFVFCILFLPQKKEAVKNLCVIFAVCILLYGSMFAFLGIKGAFGAYWHYNFESAVSSKGGGSIFVILFGWIPRSKRQILLYFPLAMLTAGAIIGEIVLSQRKNKQERNPRFEIGLLIAAALLAILAVVLCTVSYRYADVQISGYYRKFIGFFFASILFVISAFLLIFYKKVKIKNFSFCCKYFYLSGVAFVLVYAVCTSGAVTQSQVALGWGLVVTSVIAFANFPKKEIVAVAMAAFMFFDVSSSFALKTIITYSWWDLDTGTLWEQTTECEVPILQGIKMSEPYARMYDNVYREVTENTREDEEIFVFPHMPVLYLATGRNRATFTVVQWFDVSTDENVVKDIDVIREKAPKIMVLCFIDETVRDTHEEFFRKGEKSGLTLMQEFLQEFVVEKNYTLLSADTVSKGYTVEVYLLP